MTCDLIFKKTSKFITYAVPFREGTKSFLWSVRESNGAFRMHVDGELDVRGAYCAVTVARLSGISPNNKLFEGTSQWIASCQTYEGGFGGFPGKQNDKNTIQSTK